MIEKVSANFSSIYLLEGDNTKSSWDWGWFLIINSLQATQPTIPPEVFNMRSSTSNVPINKSSCVTSKHKLKERERKHTFMNEAPLAVNSLGMKIPSGIKARILPIRFVDKNGFQSDML